MLAYIVRRLLLIVPTLFGIMVVNFVVIQAAPGGPVEQLIATMQGTAVDATARVAGGGGGDGGHRRRGAGRRPGLRPVPRRARPRPRAAARPRAPVRLRQAGARALRRHDLELRPFRLRRELLPRPARRRPGAVEDAGVDLARPVDDPVDIPDLDPPRNRQGGARRQPVRRLDLGGGGGRATRYRGSCSPSCSSSCSRAGAISTGSRCAASLLPAPRTWAGRRRPPITSGTWRCRCCRWSSAASPG